MNKPSSEQMKSLIREARRTGSFREAVLAHNDEYGIENIDYAFGNPKVEVASTRKPRWVDSLLQALYRTPFRRLKTIVTDEGLHAVGYEKTAEKIESPLSVTGRVTLPTTIYTRKQIDRDDVIDITDFDVVTWLRSQMVKARDLELVRAILIGDGRAADDPDKIDELCIRPIASDDDAYVVRPDDSIDATAMTWAEQASAFVAAFLAVRDNYAGPEYPDLFISDRLFSEILQLTDESGAFLYTRNTLADILRVRFIIPISLFDRAGRIASDDEYRGVMAIAFNPEDYAVGGVTDDFMSKFDMDFNRDKYLLETRCSGALIRLKSAIVIDKIRTAPVVGIRVTTPPTKTEYVVGETFDPTGMVVSTVNALGETGDEVPADQLRYNPDGPLQTDDTEVVITAEIPDEEVQ